MVVQADRLEWIAKHILPHEPHLRVWLRGLSGIEVDDIVQDTYAILIEADVAHIQSPRAYLFTVARNLVLQHYRRAKIISIVALADFDAQSIMEDAPPVDEVVSARQELARLHATMAELPEKCRDVLVLRRVEGWSQKQVAHHLGVSENVVEKQLARALRLLGRAFGRGGPDQNEVARSETAQHRSIRRHHRPG
ncbi:sigma-70 family RNA polymerase sigma factor [Gluconacetobacter azotocaptans]|uniref:RNA polymerase sigma factor n=1 Tax=Gluconacetobacter azotocaptans TaxID=142834 RepID=UPI00195B63F6|nr:sigma-70 family RNA polymerase sigma factor [Gluconacetobacter azotocaptans]MBM9402763.1 sigma-70 family RNA polymerase sigma factor [Gluconacetobacter azotocaptans]